MPFSVGFASTSGARALKAHIGADTAHGLVHTLEVTTGKVSDYSMAETLLHGDERTAHGDRGYADKTREPDRPHDEDAVGPRWFVPFKRAKGCDTTFSPWSNTSTRA
ncbi:transposase [Acidiphilium sp.]|uniref:transposase n=1 Tax=Acidiphilium sp. TaxID=527 RepID=UPI00338E1EFF